MKNNKNSLSQHVWPGFVDALLMLLTVILFVFMIFIISYAYLGNVALQKEKNLSQALSQKEELSKILHNLDEAKVKNEEKITLYRNELQKLYTMYHALQHLLTEKNKEIDGLQKKTTEKVQALETEITAKNTSLKNLNAEIQRLLAEKVKQLSEYQSDFFGQLKKALKNRKDIRIVGDRFIFQSEIIFSMGSADLSGPGKVELSAFADALKKLISLLPQSLPWVLRVDGHTDNIPVRSKGKFSSNLELSVARAISVINFLIQQGIPEERLAAAGFGAHRPLVPKTSSPKDRRIELLIDQGY